MRCLTAETLSSSKTIPVRLQRSCNPNSVSLGRGACDEQRLRAAHYDCDKERLWPSDEKDQLPMINCPLSIVKP